MRGDKMKWQPIETAPKDGSLIDVWCIDPDGQFKPKEGGIRLTDVWWSLSDKNWQRMLDDGDFDEVELWSKNNLSLPPWKPIFWMPLPDPPKQ